MSLRDTWGLSHRQFPVCPVSEQQSERIRLARETLCKTGPANIEQPVLRCVEWKARNDLLKQNLRIVEIEGLGYPGVACALVFVDIFTIRQDLGIFSQANDCVFQGLRLSPVEIPRGQTLLAGKVC